MAFIDVLTYRGSHNTLVWKWEPEEKRWGQRQDELRLGTQLVVGPAQVAVFVKEGQVADIFAPGTFTLSTKNLPILDRLVGLPFGKESPFKAEVYYINKAVVMNTKFSIPPFNMLDHNFRVPIPVQCSGSFAVRAGEARLFLTKLFGSGKSLNTETLRDYFSGLISEQIKSAVTRFAREHKLGPMELEALVYDVSTDVSPIIEATLARYGIKLELFNIEAIAIVDTDVRVKKVIEDYQRLMSQDIEERLRLRRRAENLDVYRVERQFDTTEKAAESLGTMGGDSSGVVGTIVGMGVAQPLANQMSGMMGGMMNNMGIGASPLMTPQTTTPGGSDIFTLLKELDGLRKAGVLTEEEFASKKQEILSKI